MLCVSLFAQKKPNRPNSTIKPNTSNYKTSNKVVNETLIYINDILSKYNIYNSSFKVDMSKKEISFIDKFSILTAKWSEIEFYNTNNNIGFGCKDKSDCLTDRDFDTGALQSPRSTYSLSIKEDDEKMIYQTNVIVGKLNNMLDNLTSGGAVSNSSVVDRNLKIINDAFKKYNTYDAKFSVRGGRIHLDNSVSNFSADMNDVIFYVNYENKWMVLKCIKDGCFDGTSFEDEYSMSLKTSSGAICPNIDEVLEAFNNIRRDVLRRQ
jgi:hypothetical protein